MKKLDKQAKIIFLHHSTGNCIWEGGVPEWFAQHNVANHTRYEIVEQAFPKEKPYGWKNYPYDYWNIWVRHAGPEPFMGEPTLEILAATYDVIVFKHCFPVSSIQPDAARADVASEAKTIANYRLQYDALKAKLHQFPDTRFVLWTAAALVEAVTKPAEAQRTRQFVDWVKNDWHQRDDNIFLWDFYALETEGGLYLRPDYAQGEKDPHPNQDFSRQAAPSLCQAIVRAIENKKEQ